MTDRSNSTVAQFEVRSNGTPIPQSMVDDVTAITVESSVHQPDMAVLSVIDTDFRWSAAAELEPGRELRISFGYGRDFAEVFVGEITAVEISAEPRGGQRLVVRGYDRAHRMHRMHRGPKARTFLQMSDSDIASQIAGRSASARMSPPPARSTSTSSRTTSPTGSSCVRAPASTATSCRSTNRRWSSRSRRARPRTRSSCAGARTCSRSALR